MRLLAALAVITVAGCASAPPLPEPPLETVVPPNVVAESPTAAAPQAPPPAAAPAPEPKPRPRDVAVLYDAKLVSAVSAATEIAAALPADRYRVSQIEIGAAAAALGELAAPPAAIIAVGLPAVETARARFPETPIVFTQVFAYEQALAGGGKIWGVHSLPPFALQLEKWKAIDPTLDEIALIIGDTHSALAAEAVSAAGSLAADVRVATSSSDRETLYLFKRLAPDVDGLWLLPDNRVLSPGVLRELLSYASSHGVGVLAFNDSLLSWGALLSASSVPEDVARTVRSVLDRVVSGQTKDLSPMTPLSALVLRINPEVATMLGLPPVVDAEWLAREPD
jgi:ABC-type uncharacterized transport system substrate-binding protein